LFLSIIVGLYPDSKFMWQFVDDPQWITNFAMLIGFVIVYRRVTQRLREQMVYAVLIAVVGEYLFSIGLGMYTYRLGNVPHYVPLGHAILYVAVMYFIKKVYVKANRQNIELLFTGAIIFYATGFLFAQNDWFGWLLTMLTLFILRRHPRERLFYLTMYISVAFLEIVGTSYGCWWWPETAFDRFHFLPSANPPSGISFFYFGLDLGCLWLYKKRHQSAWVRMKTQRALKTRVLSKMS